MSYGGPFQNSQLASGSINYTHLHKDKRVTCCLVMLGQRDGTLVSIVVSCISGISLALGERVPWDAERAIPLSSCNITKFYY